MNSANGEAMDVQIFQMNIGRVFGVEPYLGPLAKGVGIALAGQASGVTIDTIGVIGDLQASDLDVAGIGQLILKNTAPKIRPKNARPMKPIAPKLSKIERFFSLILPIVHIEP